MSARSSSLSLGAHFEIGVPAQEQTLQVRRNSGGQNRSHSVSWQQHQEGARASSSTKRQAAWGPTMVGRAKAAAG